MIYSYIIFIEINECAFMYKIYLCVTFGKSSTLASRGLNMAFAVVLSTFRLSIENNLFYSLLYNTNATYTTTRYENSTAVSFFSS